MTPLDANAHGAQENLPPTMTQHEQQEPAVVKETIDFERAKNFWQSRVVRAQSRCGDAVPAGANGSGVITTDSSPSSTTSASEAVGDLAVEASLPGPSTPNEKYPGELKEEPEAKRSPLAPTASTTGSALQRMASFRPKFFGSSNSSGDLKPSGEKESESTSASLPSLPDMSSWKEKMKLTRPAAPKVSFSFEKLKTSLSSASLVAGEADKAADASAARNNIHRPTVPTKLKSGAVNPSSSEFGQLIVAEVLAAKDLSAGDFFQGESDPYIIVKFQDFERRTSIVKGTKSPVFNERFVFYLPPAQNTREIVSITVMNKNMVMSDEHLGEVHVSLDIPMNEAFDEWYPLIKETGERKGHVRIGVRRMELTSVRLQTTAQALASNDRSLNDEDLAVHGSVIPDLWYGFAEAAEPLEAKICQTDVLATKLNDLSRRFIGIEISSTELTADGQRRNIF